jgi:hypothetical protein
MDSWLSTLCIEQDTLIDGHFDCEQIGAPESSHTRSLKISFSSKSRTFELPVKSKNLKDDDEYSNIFIDPDRTR